MRKILLIDDDQAIIDLYVVQFLKRGHKISFAMNGKMGVEMVGRKIPDIVLLDVIMPKMDGFETLIAIRKAYGYNFPIILLTNLGQGPDLDRGKGLGANDYWIKASLTPTQLVNKVEKFLKTFVPMPPLKKK